MRILSVVQRYGDEVAGGAERHCRELATRLAARGHDVHVLTTCAVSYMDWADWYPAGTDIVDGVGVHRLPVVQPRDWRFFGPLDRRVVWGSKPVPRHLQLEWMRQQGPYVPQAATWLAEHAAEYDLVVFFTYLYYTTWIGIGAAAKVVPTLLHPAAHREPALQLPLFDEVFHSSSALALSTPEEAMIVRERFGLRTPQRVIGIGVELDADRDESFDRRFGLEDVPYVAFVGRVDPNKGADELHEYFGVYKDRNPGPLKLVMVGEQFMDLPDHPDVVVTGFVDDASRWAAIANSLAVVQPSYFESFAMTVTEAWAMRRPVLVNGRCEVLRGQVLRGGGGLPYHGFAEFEAALQLLVDRPTAADSMGLAGRDYVERNYTWDRLLRRYEEYLEQVASRRLSSTVRKN
jgi:glycosyltransferase involved in cell wall biosynthesis